MSHLEDANLRIPGPSLEEMYAFSDTCDSTSTDASGTDTSVPTTPPNDAANLWTKHEDVKQDTKELHHAPVQGVGGAQNKTEATKEEGKGFHHAADSLAVGGEQNTKQP